ncbi:GlxA family transcriptional regulator [Photobacterium alginatilyticum]|uniref:Helix-turn-helix domain-containing protein n=1 Tax=Photobacterium alginatilyticum TaxID=1775171 RepID=A0ABW9YIA5_9GAMM|nr:helix-turn-helix domain-containing protein [Photobacterium alginatilyticum]NBI53297.1 helix-turn-helix domain-containing protein [Photobacterium alginatilyticum]
MTESDILRSTALLVPPSPDVRFLLLPLPEFNMLPFGGFLDKLRFSADEEDHSRQRYCSWEIVGIDKEPVISSSGVPVVAQKTAGEVELASYDYLVVFGGRSARSSQQLTDIYGGMLREAAAKGVALVSIDNACFLFAAAGLLDDHSVAVHWRHVPEFRTAYPRIAIQTEQLYCIDGKRISCAGGSAAVDLAVELVARHCGRAKALKGLADMLVDEARGQLHQLKSLDEDIRANNTAGRHVGRAISLMRQLLAEPKTVDELADMLAISRRQLDRLCKQSLGMTAREYWAEMRLKHVHWRVINSNHSLQCLADEVGVHDVSYLCKLFRKRYGISPSKLRQISCEL